MWCQCQMLLLSKASVLVGPSKIYSTAQFWTEVIIYICVTLKRWINSKIKAKKYIRHIYVILYIYISTYFSWYRQRENTEYRHGGRFLWYLVMILLNPPQSCFKCQNRIFFFYLCDGQVDIEQHVPIVPTLTKCFRPHTRHMWSVRFLLTELCVLCFLPPVCTVLVL